MMEVHPLPEDDDATEITDAIVPELEQAEAAEPAEEVAAAPQTDYEEKVLNLEVDPLYFQNLAEVRGSVLVKAVSKFARR